LTFNKKKIFLIISCLLNIACVWTALTIQIRYDYQQTKEAAETNVFNLAKAFEEHISNRVKDIDRLLLDLSAEYRGNPTGFTLKTERSSELGYENLHISIALINKEGHVIYSDQPSTAVTRDMNDLKELVKNLAIRNDSLYILKPLLDTVSGKWSLGFAKRLHDKNGAFSGIIIAFVPPSFLSDFFRSITIGPQGVISLFGTDKYILARATGIKNINDATGRQIPADHPLVSNNIQNGIYHSLDDLDGMPRLSAFKKIHNYPLVVQVSLAEEHIYLHSSKRKMNIFIIGTIMTVALLGALAVLMLFEREQQRLLEKLSKRDEQLQATLVELEHLATTDTLTGLPNRRSFFARAQTEFTRANRYDRPLSLVMIDVDHFKDVNDRYGHSAGDEALRHVSEIMKDCIRESDMVARYGGEEFVLILPETDPDGAYFIAERVRTEIEMARLQITPATELKITVSLGIACMSHENQLADIDKLLQEADDAMYLAKRGGRNCIHMTTSSNWKEMALLSCDT
jgi:diguanylate cyclase (GGDEF)-like protein